MTTGAAVLLAMSVIPIGAEAGSPPPLPQTAVPAPPAAISLAALKQVEPGLWQLEVQGRAARTSCVADPIELIQIEHAQPSCSRFVIANEPRSATVQYSCQGAGWGRTTVRVETPRFATIRTQGIVRNAPFDYSVEARRVGDCAELASKKPR